MRKQAGSLKVHKSATCSWPSNPDALAVFGLIPGTMRHRFHLGSYVVCPPEEEPW